MLVLQGPDLYERMQGGILGNAISSIFSILGTSLPNVAFAQNNGVIALTRVASRQVCSPGKFSDCIMAGVGVTDRSV